METSPFVFDGPAPPEDVIGRDPELAALMDRAMHGRFVLLFAPRRYGKTSLIHRLRHDASGTGDLVVVLVDLLGVQTLSDISGRIGAAYRALPEGRFRAALRRLAGRSPVISAQIGYGPMSLKVEAQRPPEPATLEDLLHLPYQAAGTAGVRVLVAMDEFQAVSAVAHSTEVIRATIQHQRDRLSYLFSGSEQSLLTAIFGARAAPLFGQAEQFQLGPLPDDDLATFVEDKFRATDRLMGSALPSLLGLAAGHPQRSAYLAHHVWEHTPPGASAGDDEWEAGLARALRQSDAEFQATEAGLEPGQRKTARLLAWGEPPFGSAARRLGLAKGTAQGALRALQRAGMMWRRNGRQPILTDPLFAEWIRHRHTRP